MIICSKLSPGKVILDFVGDVYAGGVSQRPLCLQNSACGSFALMTSDRGPVPTAGVCLFCGLGLLCVTSGLPGMSLSFSVVLLNYLA